MRVVVIGAGIVGASTAFHLTRADDRADVVVVDQAHPGKATLAGAGIVCPWSSAAEDGPYLDLYMAGAAAYHSIVAQISRHTGPDLGVDIGYRKVGGLFVSANVDDGDGADRSRAAELDAAEERLVRRSVDRPEVGRFRRLDSAATRALFPPLRPGLEAVHIAGGARVDGRLLARALLDASGASRIITPALAELRLSTTGDRVTGVRVGDEEIEADAVVAATGAWTPALLEPLASPTSPATEAGVRAGATAGAPADVRTGGAVQVRVDVEPQKGQIMHLGLVGTDTSRWPVVLPNGPHYLVAFDDGRVVVGGTREFGSGFDVRVTAAGHATLLDSALSLAPGLADATILETRVGLRPLAAGGVPTIGAVPGVGGLFVGTGLGAAGLTMGPLFGRLLAEVTLGRRPAEIAALAQPSTQPPVGPTTGPTTDPAAGPMTEPEAGA